MDRGLLIRLRVERLREIQVELEEIGCDDISLAIEERVAELMVTYYALLGE